MRRIGMLAAAMATAATATAAAATPPVRTYDGSANNQARPGWGKANTPYLRVAPARYADGIAAMAGGPSPRYVSNRVFDDRNQNLFSENDVSQWVWTWGQFVDHDLGLRDERPGESAPMPFGSDPLEEFRNDFGNLAFSRTPAAPGTGTGRTPRQQVNTVSSYLDGSQVYGSDGGRAEWLRAGPVNGDDRDNAAALLLSPNRYLPRVTARGNAAGAPPMDLMGGLVGTPNRAVVAGDVRANENIALTATQTLFAREHNRIVAVLPANLSANDRYQIARRVVGAEIQYITYREFLPAVGVRLPTYTGYRPNVDATLSNEFATVGFRAHSMVHGEFEPSYPEGTFTAAQLAAFDAVGIEAEHDAGTVTLVVPLNIAFGNPDLLEQLGIGQVLASLGEHQYRNDEQIDNALRSVLFQLPQPGHPEQTGCFAPVIDPACFQGVVDLGAADIARGRDHGIPPYNDLRRAYGLGPERSFTEVTGESTDRFPRDPLIDQARPIDDPQILDFTSLRDLAGQPLPLGNQEDAVAGTRRSTLAARLRAVYGSVDRLDSFVGMASERHPRGSELGELQQAMWRKQFADLRDGDRFFYLNDPALLAIGAVYGVSYRHTLSELIRLNTGTTVPANVFRAG